MTHRAPSASTRKASHCGILLERRIEPADAMEQWAALGERFARALRPGLMKWSGSSEIEARSAGAERMTGAVLMQRLENVAANSLYDFASKGDRILLSLEARALMEQLDRAFGGTGYAGDEPLKTLPGSADLLAQQLEKRLVAALSANLGGQDLHARARDPHYAEIAAFSSRDDLAVITIEVAEAGRSPWRITLAANVGLLGKLAPSSRGRKQRPARPDMGPFAEMPLRARATLVDMTVPLGRLAGLVPGAVLPIAVARNVPLRIGEITVARGTIGEMDDRVALQITQTHNSGKDLS